MDVDDSAFYDTAMTVVARYGMKRTTMADLARAADVSRQTLYDRFGDKDGIMAALIEHMSARMAKDLRTSFDASPDLAAKIDAYFKIAVWPMFDLMQTMPDAVDIEKGMAAASTSASQKGSLLKQSVLADMLAGHLSNGSQAPADVAAFIEQSSTQAKKSATTRAELERFLSVLKAGVVALAKAA